MAYFLFICYQLNENSSKASKELVWPIIFTDFSIISNTLITLVFADSPSLNASYPRDHTVVEGTNLTLRCKLTAANPPSNITWYNASSNSTALATGENFTFQNILRSDAGQYYCVAENGGGQATISRISTVDVLCKYRT